MASNLRRHIMMQQGGGITIPCQLLDYIQKRGSSSTPPLYLTDCILSGDYSIEITFSLQGGADGSSVFLVKADNSSNYSYRIDIGEDANTVNCVTTFYGAYQVVLPYSLKFTGVLSVGQPVDCNIDKSGGVFTCEVGGIQKVSKNLGANLDTLQIPTLFPRSPKFRIYHLRFRTLNKDLYPCVLTGETNKTPDGTTHYNGEYGLVDINGDMFYPGTNLTGGMV